MRSVTIRGAAMPTYLVNLPSGKQFRLTGKFRIHALGHFLVPVIWLDKAPKDPRISPGLVIDQRAEILEGGHRVYHPRRYLDGLAPAATEWLDEHPEWT